MKLTERRLGKLDSTGLACSLAVERDLDDEILIICSLTMTIFLLSGDAL